MTTTFEGLRDIIVRDFELAPERLRRDTPLEEIELDSLAITELVFALEDDFHVTAGNVVPPFETLGDIADYIDRLIAERDAAPAPRAATAAVPKPARSSAAKSVPAARAESASATRASSAKTSRAAVNGTKADPAKRAGTKNAHRANGRKPPAANAAQGGAPSRKRKRASATASGARSR
jgi:acyl carrier protein